MRLGASIWGGSWKTCGLFSFLTFNTGVAIGLFALLGIIRFRTDPIPIKDMSYLFIFIGLSMINAFSKKMSIYEIAFINLLLMSMATFAEIFLYKRPVVKKTASMELVYGNLLNLKPENKESAAYPPESGICLGYEFNIVLRGKKSTPFENQ